MSAVLIYQTAFFFDNSKEYTSLLVIYTSDKELKTRYYLKITIVSVVTLCNYSYNTEHCTLHNHRCENLKSNVSVYFTDIQFRVCACMCDRCSMKVFKGKLNFRPLSKGNARRPNIMNKVFMISFITFRQIMR
jgi:hypothetical protein